MPAGTAASALQATLVCRFARWSERKRKNFQLGLNCLIDVQKLHVDGVIETCQVPPQTVLSLLLELELRGLVVQHPGKLFTLP
jgi:predicted Rossmann fold nucleotide-binding protein DprA/Smf involved in DNA uptake